MNNKKPNNTPLIMLTHYKAWADEITYKSVATLPEMEITKIRQTNFKTIIHTLNHVYVVDDIFKAHLTGKQHNYTARNTENTPEMNELWQMAKGMNQFYIDLATQLTSAELSEIIEFDFVGGGKGAMSRMEIILHVVNHATYHRGFVSDMMYQTPKRMSANDLPVFLRDSWNNN